MASHHDTQDALRLEGLTWAEKGHMTQAIDCFSRALNITPLDANLHNNIANAYKKQQRIDQAIMHYQEAIRLDPHYAQAHNNLAGVFAHHNRYHEALHHYRRAVHAAPDFALAHYNLGLLLLKHQEWAAAKTQFNNVVNLNPHQLQAHFYLGVLALSAHDLDEAEQAFQNVLQHDAEHVDTLVNLGVIALKREQGQLAIDYFTKALVLDHDHVEARNNMAATFIHHDRFENALMHYTLLLERFPADPEYLYNAGVADMALGHLQKARAHFETLLTQQPQHFAALTNLAAIHTRLNERQQAIALLTKAHDANPDDPSCKFMLNALTGKTFSTETCPDYARNLFNNYALYYDQHMQNTLHYTIPQHVARALHACLASHWPVARILDLGCGTGLTGIVLRELTHHLTGVDLALKMLNQAKTKALYDELVESELLLFLQQDTSSYQVIAAADVLPYLSELDTLFDTVHHRLEPSGFWIFSIEISEHEPFFLQDNARFSHHPHYIEELANQHQFTIIDQQHIVARQQLNRDVSVLLYVMQTIPS